MYAFCITMNKTLMAFYREVAFKDLPYNAKFIVNDKWYRKVTDKRAVKLNHPGEGNSKRVRPNVKVYVEQ